jgi:hypothetical protein
LKAVTDKSAASNRAGKLQAARSKLVDELILLANVSGADPPCLSLANHVNGLVSRNRVLRGIERAKTLLGLRPVFNRAVVLLQDVFKYCPGRWRHRRRRVTSAFKPTIAAP